MSIQIFFDTYRIQKGHDLLQVYSRKEYLDACKSVELALQTRQSLQIAVTNPAMAGWFDHFKGYPTVVMKRLDPVNLLSESLNVHSSVIPKELSEDPRFIVEEELILRAKQNPRWEGQSVISWVLKQTAGETWQLESIDDPISLGRVLSALIFSNSQTIPPTSLALINTLLKQLSLSGPYTRILGWLCEDSPSVRARRLLLARLVSLYPHEIQMKVRQYENAVTDLAHFDDLPSILAQIPLDSCKNVTLSFAGNETLRTFLQNRLAEMGIEGALQFVTGILDVEEAVLRNYLKDHSDELDDTWVGILHDIEARFASVEGNSDFVNWLRRISPVPQPSLLTVDMPWDKVEQWLNDEYFPFYTWAAAVGQVEKTTKSVGEFENWLLKNYRLITKSEVFAPLAIRELLSTFSITRIPMLIVVDGLPWEYAAFLQKLLFAGETLIIDVRSVIAGIPSATSYAKPSLVGGKLPGQISDEGVPYSRQFAEALNSTESETTVGSPSGVTIVDLIREKKRAYLYLFNKIDQVVHEPGSADMRQVSIHNILREFASQVINAIDQFRRLYHEELLVIITSDHGFTELPVDCAVLPVPEDAVEFVSHNRLVHFPKPDYPQIDGLSLIDNEILADFPGTLQLANGYNCVRSRPRGAVHGGLTPQEMIIPIIVVDASKRIEYQSVEIALEGEIRRGRADNPLVVTIVNPNSLPVFIQQIGLRLVKLEDQFPVKVGPGQSVSIKCVLDGSKLISANVNITGTVTIEFNGQSKTQDIYRDFRTTGAALADSDFESEFDL